MKKIIISISIALLPFLANAFALNNSFNIGTLFPNIGGTTSASSSCGSAGANSTVNFAIWQNGSSAPLLTNLSTNINGDFSGNIVFPTNISSGQATLIATCKLSGDTITSPVLTFASPVSTSFGLSAIQPTVGGLFNVSGSCGGSNGTGNAQLSITSNNVNYQLGTFNLSSIGVFTTNVVIPNNLNTGQVTLSASCSNGNNFSTNIIVGLAAVNSFTLSSNPTPGLTIMVSGGCTNVSSNQNGPMTFSLLRNGSTANLPATNNLTNSNGFFNSSVYFPSTIGNDPATLIVTCPNNSTFSNVIMLGSVTTPIVLPPILPPNIPVGGINAGFGPQKNVNYLIDGFLLALGLITMLAVGKKLYAQK